MVSIDRSLRDLSIGGLRSVWEGQEQSYSAFGLVVWVLVVGLTRPAASWPSAGVSMMREGYGVARFS